MCRARRTKDLPHQVAEGFGLGPAGEVGNGFDVPDFQVQGHAPEMRMGIRGMFIGLKALDTALAFHAGIHLDGVVVMQG